MSIYLFYLSYSLYVIESILITITKTKVTYNVEKLYRYFHVGIIIVTY